MPDLLVRQERAHPLLVEEGQERQEVEIAVPGRIGGEIIVDERAKVRPVVGIGDLVHVFARERVGEAEEGAGRVRRDLAAKPGVEEHEGLEDTDDCVRLAARHLGIEVQPEGVERPVLRALAARPPQHLDRPSTMWMRSIGIGPVTSSHGMT